MEALNCIGLAETMYDEERYDEALIHAGRALAIQEQGFFAGTPGRSWARRAVGLVHYQRGERTLARRFLEEAVDEARAVEGLGWWLSDALACAAQLEIDSHRLPRADALLKEALEIAVSLGDQRMLARCLERLAYLASVRGQYQRALRLDGAAEAIRQAVGLPRAPVDVKTLHVWLAPAERVLEPNARERARGEGASVTLDNIVTFALKADFSARPQGRVPR
jgi:tetratricopeptide (TPR) repeat protein